MHGRITGLDPILDPVCDILDHADAPRYCHPKMRIATCVGGCQHSQDLTHTDRELCHYLKMPATGQQMATNLMECLDASQNAHASFPRTKLVDRGREVLLQEVTIEKSTRIQQQHVVLIKAVNTSDLYYLLQFCIATPEVQRPKDQIIGGHRHTEPHIFTKAAL